MGYALLDVNGENFTPDDPRINNESWAIEREDNIPSLEDFLKYMEVEEEKEAEGKEHYLPDRFMLQSALNDENWKRKLPRSLEYCFTYDGEFGDSKVLVITPPTSYDDWYRYDDAIDYYEASPNAEPHIQELSHGIYPYLSVGWVGDKPVPEGKEGRDISSLFYEFKRWKNNLLDANDVKDEVWLNGLANLAKAFGCETWEEADKCIAPIVPGEVKWLCKFAGIFKDPEETFKQMRPIIYTYWG